MDKCPTVSKDCWKISSLGKKEILLLLGISINYNLLNLPDKVYLASSPTTEKAAGNKVTLTLPAASVVMLEIK